MVLINTKIQEDSQHITLNKHYELRKTKEDTKKILFTKLNSIVTIEAPHNSTPHLIPYPNFDPNVLDVYE